MAEKFDESLEDVKAEKTADSGESKAFDPETATREEWEALLAAKNEELAQQKERVLRIAAEMENTRKRIEREAADGVCYANERLLRELLPVLDNLERAIEHGETDPDIESLLDGVRMTQKGFVDALGKFGCKSVESLGKDFDPNYHEAMMRQDSPDHDDNKVIQEFRKGYVLNERLIRPALVVVSKKAG
ncbi:MAG: nucleotide exchange factor GrpE [Syntrophobacteraceae bacterium]